MTGWLKAIDEWSSDHPVLGWMSLPLTGPVMLLDSILNGRRRSGFPVCPSMPLTHDGLILTADERAWREIRWKEMHRRGRDRA